MANKGMRRNPKPSLVCLICHHQNVITYLEGDLADKRCQLSMGITKEEIEQLKADIEKVRSLIKDAEKIIHAVYKNEHHKHCGNA